MYRYGVAKVRRGNVKVGKSTVAYIMVWRSFAVLLLSVVKSGSVDVLLCLVK